MIGARLRLLRSLIAQDIPSEIVNGDECAITLRGDGSGGGATRTDRFSCGERAKLHTSHTRATVFRRHVFSQDSHHATHFRYFTNRLFSFLV